MCFSKIPSPTSSALAETLKIAHERGDDYHTILSLFYYPHHISLLVGWSNRIRPFRPVPSAPGVNTRPKTKSGGFSACSRPLRVKMVSGTVSKSTCLEVGKMLDPGNGENEARPSTYPWQLNTLNNCSLPHVWMPYSIANHQPFGIQVLNHPKLRY